MPRQATPKSRSSSGARGKVRWGTAAKLAAGLLWRSDAARANRTCGSEAKSRLSGASAIRHPDSSWSFRWRGADRTVASSLRRSSPGAPTRSV